jgi:hypothetical protein
MMYAQLLAVVSDTCALHALAVSSALHSLPCCHAVIEQLCTAVYFDTLTMNHAYISIQVM